MFLLTASEAIKSNKELWCNPHFKKKLCPYSVAINNQQAAFKHVSSILLTLELVSTSPASQAWQCSLSAGSAQVLINHLGVNVEQKPHPVCDTNNSNVCVCERERE